MTTSPFFDKFVSVWFNISNNPQKDFITAKGTLSLSVHPLTPERGNHAIQYLNNKGPGGPKNQGQYQLDSSGNPFGPCIACNPENNRIRSAVTLLNKNYYTDTNAYLKSRCMTYDQKLSITDISNNQYLDANGNILYPTKSSNGPQVFNMLNCCTDKCSKRQITIYKPSNHQFAVQGAVSSSGRIAKLKYDTITRNGASFKTAYGQQGANAGKYATSSNAPYFLKSKENIGTSSYYTWCNIKVNINAFTPLEWAQQGGYPNPAALPTSWPAFISSIFSFIQCMAEYE